MWGLVVTSSAARLHFYKVSTGQVTLRKGRSFDSKFYTKPFQRKTIFKGGIYIMKRKLLSVALSLSLVMGSMGAAFAAPAALTEGIEDANVVKAVERLSAFGIIGGFEDGKYHQEQNMTREQFAKVLVIALGLENAADAAKGQTTFADVSADRWSAGYVNVAAGQGILKGYPDGTFQPSKEVNYAEAVTMLVRALGYKDEFVPGSWPGNYIAKAADKGITSKAKFDSPSGLANRGVVAVLLNNTLDAKVVEVAGYDEDYLKTSDKSINYRESNLTLLEKKLEIVKINDVRVVENARLNQGLEKNELIIKTTKEDIVIDGEELDKGKKIKYEFVENFDSNYFLGHEVALYVNDSDEVVFAEIDSNDTIYKGARIDEAYVNEPVGEIKLVSPAKSFKVKSDKDGDVLGDIYLNGEKLEDEDELDALKTDVYGTFVIDNNEVVYADLLTWKNTDYLVQEVDAEKGKITYLNTREADDKRKFDLEDNYDGYHVYLDGKEIELKDLKPYDVFNVAETKENGDDYAAVYVWRSVVEGEAGKVTGGNDAQTLYMEIGGEKKRINVPSTYSLDKEKNYKKIEAANTDGRDKLDDFYKENVKAYMNWKGRAALVVGDAKETSDTSYGVILKTGTGIEEAVKLYTSADDDIVYKFEDGDDYDYVASKINLAAANEVYVLKYELTKDGKIAEFEREKNGALKEEHVFKLSNADSAEKYVIAEGDDFGTKSVEITNVKDGQLTKYVTDSTVFFDATKKDKDDVEVFKWSDLKNKDVEQDVDVFALYDNKNLELLVVWNNLGNIKDDTMPSFVVDTYMVDGDRMVEVYTYDVDGTKEYEVDGTIGDEIDERVGLFKTASGGKLTQVTKADAADEDYRIVAGVVTDIDGSKVAINGEKYEVKDDAVIINADIEKATFSSIEEDDFIAMVLHEDEAEVVHIAYSKTAGDNVVMNAEVVANDGDEITLDKEYKGKAIKLTDDTSAIYDEDGYLMDDTFGAFENITIGSKINVVFNTSEKEAKAIYVVELAVEDEEVEAVIDAIAALPAAAAVTLADADDINEAVEMYNDLSAAQQELVTNYEKLEAAVEALEALEPEVEAFADVTVETLAFGPSTVFTVTVNDVEGLEGAEKAALDNGAAKAFGQQLTTSVTTGEVTLKILNADGDVLATAELTEDVDGEIELTVEE